MGVVVASAEVVPVETPAIIKPTLVIPTDAEVASSSNWGDFDFIDAYTDYADVAEIPREAHEATACQLIASILNRNGVSIIHQGNSYTLDVWQILISESGGGRSTLLRGVKSLLRKASLEGLLKDSHWGSEAAMYQHFAENPHSFMVWGEFSEMLGRLNNYGDCKAWLTDRYDDTDPPNNRRYRKTGKPGNDTPDIVFPVAPRTNITATSSEGWFFRNMKTDDSSGGFLPRWWLVRTGSSRNVSTVPEFDLAKQSKLVEYLEHIERIKGMADISNILPYYDDDAWYNPTKGRFLTQTDQRSVRFTLTATVLMYSNWR